MGFGDDLRRFARVVDQRARAIHNGVADLAFSSIVEGSPVTGAPGQPVDTGYLKGSWQNLIDGPLTRRIVTNVAYAPVIEENMRAAYNPRGATNNYGVLGGLIGPALPGRGAGGKHIKSVVGGHHSVKLTVTAWPRIVDHVTRKVAANG